MLNIKTNPYKAVSFNENAIMKAAEKAGSLIADIKYDGVRLNLIAKHTGGFFLSRTSKSIPALEHLCGFSERWEAFLADDRQIYKGGLMVDGEVMVKGVDFNTGSGILRSKWMSSKNVAFSTEPELLVRKSDKVPFELEPKHLKVVVYAVLPLDVVESGEDHDVMNCVMQYHVETVLELLKEYFPEIEWVKTESHDVFSMMQLDKLYEFVRERGDEGLVVKDPLDIYKRGKKIGWWKMKPENEADGVITGLVWGTKGKANEGKVIGFEVLLESGRVVNATNISQSLMDEFTDKYLETNQMRSIGEAVNPYDGYQCQISYMEETPDGSLRHPSFTCFRGTEDNPTEKM